METDKNHQVTLGCGTLILIAIIVLIFSNAGKDELRNELRNVQGDIGKLEDAIEAQTREIAKLRAAIEADSAKSDEAARVEREPLPKPN